jgi:hypothetical protein
MRYIIGVVACIASLAGCYEIGAPSTDCDDGVPEGELHVIIGPAPGLFGTGESVFVGDTLPLTAEVRPAAGSSIDFWGGGGCQTSYGEPIPATIEWSSSDNRIATVSATGTVSGRAEGTANIIARAPARNLMGSRQIFVSMRAGGP